MTHYESIDPKDIRTVFQKYFAIDKDTNEVKNCGEMPCAECLFHGRHGCKNIKKKWLDQPVIDWDKDIDWKKVPVDTPVIVGNELGQKEYRRYFKEKDKSYITFDDGATSWSAHAEEDNYGWVTERWDTCRLAKPEDVEKYRKKETGNE